MCDCGHHGDRGISRRAFLGVSAGAAALVPIGMAGVAMAVAEPAPARGAKAVRIVSASVYPPTRTLDEAGYYSWPGSGFNAEAHHQEYDARLGTMCESLGMTLDARGALDTEADAAKFVDAINATPPDAVVLTLLKKGHWARVMQIREATTTPLIVYAPLGVLLVDHLRPARDMDRLYLVNTDRFEAVEPGLRMIRAAASMRQSSILNIDGSEENRVTVPHLGTDVHTISHQRFYDRFKNTADSDELRALAASYKNNAQNIVEPNDEDIVEGARCYFALKALMEAEAADAMMMNCLPGLQRPHKHVPPCMAFMTLRDEGKPAGCQSDLNATLTLLLVQYLFDRPGFQQNASMDTERNLYFGAHCTCPSKMNGPQAPAEPYILHSHAEAGWGCVPRVLFQEGQEVTLAQYVTGDAPEMYIYSGAVVQCPPIPPTGGCRTNIVMSINEVPDVRDVKGMHQVIFYGNHARDLRNFCKLTGIRAVA